MSRAVLFDLDGTLVDSAPAIVATFRWVLDSNRLVARVPLDRSLIGPSLRDTLKRITGLEAGDEIERLTAAFSTRYDATVAAATPAYPGMHDTLRALSALGFELHVVTNKRIRPTRLILEHLGVAAEFRGVYALDGVDPPAPDKSALVETVLRRHGVDAARSALVGDTAGDARAAAANRLPYIGVTYGYGEPVTGADRAAATIDALHELPQALRRAIP